MDRLQHQETYDPVELVQKYIQDTVPADDLVISDGIVEHLFFKVKHLFASILLLVKHCDSDFKARIQNNSLDRSYSRLVLWYDAYQLLLGTGKSDIPSGLADEATKYLKSIGLILVDRLILLLSKAPVRLEIDILERHVLDVSSWIQKIGNLGDDDGSDTSSNFDYDSYADVAEDLRTDTACLVGVNTLLSTALNAHGVDTAWDTPVGRWEPHQPYCDRISNRFPDGVESLIARLGRANYERYLRCIQKREEDHDDQNDDRADTVVASDFHDSGLGSSIPGKSTYAETVMSYGGDGGQHTVRVPPLSAEAKKGKAFTCIACSRTVTISNNSLWKRHLYEDLRPWLCLEPTCSSGSSVFSRRDDWVAHLAFEHHMEPAWEALQCPLCCDQIGSGKASVTRHLGGHLEEIALGSLPVQTDLENNSEDGSLPSTPILGSTGFTRSSVASQIDVDTNVATTTATDQPPPLPLVSSSSTSPLQQDKPKLPSSNIFKCRICDKEFTRRINRDGHTRSHFTERRFACMACGKRFTRVNDLRRHEKLHTRALHICQTCGRKFTHKDELARHNKGPDGCVKRGTSMYGHDTDGMFFSPARLPEIHHGEGHRDTLGAQNHIANDKEKVLEKVVSGVQPLADATVALDNAGREEIKSHKAARRQSDDLNEDSSNVSDGDRRLEGHDVMLSASPKHIHDADVTESQGNGSSIKTSKVSPPNAYAKKSNGTPEPHLSLPLAPEPSVTESSEVSGDSSHDLNLPTGPAGSLRSRKSLTDGSTPQPVFSCYICGQSGHLARNCSQPRSCYICGGTGHLAKFCSTQDVRSSSSAHVPTAQAGGVLVQHLDGGRLGRRIEIAAAAGEPALEFRNPEMTEFLKKLEGTPRCVPCRRRKIKCIPDENNPQGPCRTCIRSNMECYDYVPATLATGTALNPLSHEGRTSEQRSEVENYTNGEKITHSSPSTNQLETVSPVVRRG